MKCWLQLTLIVASRHCSAASCRRCVIDLSNRKAIAMMLAAVRLIVAFPPMVPPLLLSIAALRVPVETLFAVTLIMASDPIVPPSRSRSKGRVARRGKIAGAD